MLRPRDRQILEFVAQHGPCSCITIATSTGLDREIKARCYSGGKGWIENRKPQLPPMGDPNYCAACNAPGQYTITPAGQAVLDGE